MQPSSRTRDTKHIEKKPENKGKINDLKNIKPSVLARETYSFKDVYQRSDFKVDYVYEVELIVVKDLHGYNSVTKTDEFKEFLSNELESEKYINYDPDINIRDLYPLEIHTKDKDETLVNYFDKINDLILNYDSRINRRVTKREIVYKKDKSKSIVAIRISKKGYIKLFVNGNINEYDNQNKFDTVPEKTNKPLNKVLKIYNDSDFHYLETVIFKYLSKVLQKR